MNSFLRGFLNPLSCHAIFAEKVHPSRDALIRCGTTFANNVANLVALSIWTGIFWVYGVVAIVGSVAATVVSATVSTGTVSSAAAFLAAFRALETYLK